jgi:hypothetical protein
VSAAHGVMTLAEFERAAPLTQNPRKLGRPLERIAGCSPANYA